MAQLPGRDYGGVRYFRTRETYHSKKDAEEAEATFRGFGSDVKRERSREKFKGKYQYRLYIHDSMSIAPKPPAGSGLQLQSSFGGGGGQTYFAGASPKKKGKTAAKKTAKKTAKKGSGSLAPFGVMPQGQKTLEEMAEAVLG